MGKVLAYREGQNPIPAIPEPTLDPASLKQAIMRLREAVEVMSGQRGPRDADLFQGLRTLSKQVSNEGTTRTAEIKELNEVIVEGDTVLASQYTTLSAEVVAGRQGQPSLAANFTNLNQARIDGDTALASQVTTLSAEITNAKFPFSTLSAKITNVDQARVDGDSALASSVTTVQANLDNRTAFGEVKFIASGSIWGMTATYSVYLNADGKYAGLSLGVNPDGTAAFLVDCTRFKFNNSGTGQVILEYDGQFYFNGNVKIGGNLVVTGTIDYPKLINNSISQTAFNEGLGGGVVFLSCRAGAKILITSGVRSNGSSGSGTGGAVAVLANGVTIGTYVQQESVYSVTDTGAGIVTTYVTNGTCIQLLWTAPSSDIFGFNTASVNDGKTIGYISVLEITR